MQAILLVKYFVLFSLLITIDAISCPKCFQSKINNKGVEKCVRKISCCLDNERTINCAVSPCANLRLNCPKARFCIEDYCNGCNAHFYDHEWNTISPEKCDGPDINDKIKRCSLKAESGPMYVARAPVELYAYDRVLGVCNKFLYYGQGGNQNSFTTKQKCEEFCKGVPPCPTPQLVDPPRGCRNTMSAEPSSDGCFYPTLICDVCAVNSCPACHKCEPKPDDQGFCCEKIENCIPSPPPLTVLSPPVNEETIRLCRLKEDSGPCEEAAVERWYWDRDWAICRNFTYGGCEGNDNNFNSKTDCQEKCGQVQGCPIANIAPPVPGCRWDFKSGMDGCSYPQLICPDTLGCQKDSCAKCEICDNVFEPQCNNCKPSGHKCTRDAICEKLSCKNYACEPGFKCMFDSEKGTICEPDLGKLENIRQCRLNKDVGHCFDIEQRFYWDKYYGECKSFNYTGCGGNKNRFNTKQKCLDSCAHIPACPIQDIMVPPKGCETINMDGLDGCPYQQVSCPNIGCSVNPCKQCEICTNRWESICEGFNCKPTGHTCQKDPVCEKWNCSAKNCMGSKCVFSDNGAQCLPLVPEPASQLRCRLPRDAGPCKAMIPAWYYNSKLKMCEEFPFGGCKGNANNFPTKDTCEQTCSGTPPCPIPIVPPPKTGCKHVANINSNGCPNVELVCQSESLDVVSDEDKVGKLLFW